MHSTQPTRALSTLLAVALCVGVARAQTCPSSDSFEGVTVGCPFGTPATLPDGLTEGLTAGLAVGSGDDWLRVLAPGETIVVDALFSHAQGDIELELRSDNCLTTYATASSTTDDERLVYTNPSASNRTVKLTVGLGGITICVDYALSVTTLPAPPAVGTPLCFGDGSAGPCPCGNTSTVGAGEGCESSLGYGAVLAASGSASVAADDIAFTLTQARANQPALLVQGAAYQELPFKDGVLCAANPTERVEVVFTDAAGTATTSSSIVTNGVVSAGDLRWYQMWSRDPGFVSPCGTGSNFSSGVAVLYGP